MVAGFSGGIFDGSYNNTKSLLNVFLAIGQSSWWTMTPAGYYNPFGRTYWGSIEFSLTMSGFIADNGTNGTLGLRPVINLKSTLKFTGDGTKTNPYVPRL